MTYKIEDGIPIPDNARHRYGSTYPFPNMAVGQSFFIPCADADRNKIGTRIMSALKFFVCRRAYMADWRFETHQVEGGVRCWRFE